MGLFGPLLPLGQYALDYYTPIKRDVKFVLHRWRLSRHSLFFKNPLTSEMLHFYLSLDVKDKFSETCLSFNFTCIIYHGSFMKIMTFMTSFRFSITPPSNSFH